MNKKMLALAALSLSLLAAPTMAFAQVGPVQQALGGQVLDPLATTLRVAPPKGGYVIVYRANKIVAWFNAPGVMAVPPNSVYSVAAVRGQTLLFNARVVVRQGVTDLVWGKSSQPAMAYYPAYHVRPGFAGIYGRHTHPHAHAAHAGNAAHAPHVRSAAAGKAARSAKSARGAVKPKALIQPKKAPALASRIAPKRK